MSAPHRAMLFLFTIGCSPGLAPSTDFTDADGDGVPSFSDCNDEDAGVFPGAEELCNEIDDDCDGEIDEGSATDAEVFYPDLDADGYGDDRYPTPMCSKASGYVKKAGDCEDLDADANPEGTEVCDGLDNDCDGLLDGDDDSLEGSLLVFYADADQDGFGDPDAALETCDPPTGYVDNDDDCDDSSREANPELDEVCGDGLDNDCDGTANGCGLSGTENLVTADGVIQGEGDSGYLGHSLAYAGDTDGDGVGDVIVGAYYADGDFNDRGGMVYVVEGPVTGTISASDTHRLQTTHDSDYLGYSVAGAGDLDGDGYDDVVMGAPYDDYGASNGGAAYVVFGPVTSMKLLNADMTIPGPESSEYLGWAVGGGGDYDGDGTADLLIGSRASDLGSGDAGATYLFGGPLSAGTKSALSADGILTGEASSDYSGWTVTDAGDVDGDGVGDMLIGAPGNDTNGSSAGVVYLVKGPVAGTVGLAVANARILGPGSSYQLGMAQCGGGDLDGDGKDDIALGSYYSDSYKGAVYVFLDGPSGNASATSADAIYTGEASYDYAGWSVSCGHDADSDGLADLLIGAIQADAAGTGTGETGAAYLVTEVPDGTQSLSGAQAIAEGVSTSDYTGSSVALVPDVSGDGQGDLLVGAMYDDVGSSNEGSVYMLLGGGL